MSEKTIKKRTNSNPKDPMSQLVADAFFFIVGSALYAISVNCFTAPNHIAPGGVTGLATVGNYLFGLPIGTTVILLNIPLFILSLIFFGKKFLFRTVVATVLASVVIDITAGFLPVYSGDKLLAALFGGVFSGAGLGLVFIRGATTGGVDIIGKLMKLKFPHISMGSFMLVLDMMVVIVAGIAYKSIESVLYAIIAFYISSKAIDYLLYGTTNNKMIQIVTDKGREIAKAITNETSRGVTILPVTGGYTGKERSMLLCVTRANEVALIMRIARSIDENPFIIVSQAGDVFGLGFKPHRGDVI